MNLAWKKVLFLDLMLCVKCSNKYKRKCADWSNWVCTVYTFYLAQCLNILVQSDSCTLQWIESTLAQLCLIEAFKTSNSIVNLYMVGVNLNPRNQRYTKNYKRCDKILFKLLFVLAFCLIIKGQVLILNTDVCILKHF